MILAQINPSEEHLLEFGLDVQGTVEQVTDVRFVIEGTRYNFSFPAKIENGQVTVKIPKLQEALAPGMHQSKLEVLIGDKIFIPLQESVEILENIKVRVQEQVKVENTQVKVNLVQENDYQLVTESGHQLLKKDGKYYGIIGENKTLRSAVGHDTLDDLVKYLSQYR